MLGLEVNVKAGGLSPVGRPVAGRVGLREAHIYGIRLCTNAEPRSPDFEEGE